MLIKRVPNALNVAIRNYRWTSTNLGNTVTETADKQSSLMDQKKGRYMPFGSQGAAEESPKYSRESNSYIGKPTKLIKSVLFGSREGREAENEMQQSYSQKLARGKYVHELVVHKVKPRCVDAYLSLMYVDLVLSIAQNRTHNLQPQRKMMSI